MLARIGKVIYFMGCGLAGLTMLFSLIAAINGVDGVCLFFVALTVLFWLIGRAGLFILTEES